MHRTVATATVEKMALVVAAIHAGLAQSQGFMIFSSELFILYFPEVVEKQTILMSIDMRGTFVHC